MATLDELQQGLIKADAAGNTEDAKAFADAIRAAQSQQQPAAVQAGQAINANLNSIPRQLGLTARYAIEGPAQAVQVLTEPLRYFTDKLLPDRQQNLSGLVTGTAPPPKSTPLSVQASKLADWIGLPTPQTANERVISDASRLVAGAAGGVGAARVASEAPGMVGQIAAALSANPMQQFSAAAGGGLAGGASREAGGSPLLQAGAALGGSVVGGMAPGAASTVIDAGKRLVTPKMGPQQIEGRLAAVLSDAGTDYSALAPEVQRSLRVELAQALQSGKELDPQAVRRFADFQSVGATPTRGMVSQNPVQITREQNLAKMAANGADDSLTGLPMIQNRNNAALISRMNDLGAGGGVTPRDAGEVVSSSILGQQATLRAAERSAWDEARSMPGYTQPIYPDGLNAMNRALGDEGMTGFMNPTISKYMEAFQTGQQPFTPQAYRNLQSMLAGELARGGNEAAAARIARGALESTPMTPITNPGGVDLGTAPITAQMAAALRGNDAQAGQAISAIDRARDATRAAYAFEDSSPLVQSVLSSARASEPEKIAQSYVINGTLNEAREIAQQVGPGGRETIKNALANYIKQQAVGGASDEVGKVSQSALNTSLNKIGDQKLALFFSPEELGQLQSLGRVASYMQVQPVGSAVNNSNSGALVLGRGLDMLSHAAKLGPIGKAAISDPIRQWQITLGNRAAMDVQPGLLGAPQIRPPFAPALLIPGAAAGGALLSPQ